jgi:diguanylate cyclase (GGDEF)-like protein
MRPILHSIWLGDPMNAIKTNRSLIITILLTLGSVVVFYIISINSYVLYHTVSELLSIVIAWSIFIFAVNTRRYFQSDFLVLVGIVSLFAGMFDLIHTLAYKGVNVFAGYDSNLPTQLWIVARYFESLSLLAAVFYVRRRFKSGIVLLVYLVISTILLFLVFTRQFPVCYIEGSGLTQFKIISEYVISAIFIGVLVLYHLRRQDIGDQVYPYLAAAIIFKVLSELSFTTYISVYGFSNFLGHIFKVISFALVYYAVIRTGLQQPFDMLFKDLQKAQKDEQNARQKAEARSAVMEALHDNFTDLLADKELPSLFSAMLDRSIRMLGATAGDLGIYDEASAEIRIVATHNMPSTAMGRVYKSDLGVVGNVLERLQPLAINNYQTWDSRSMHPQEALWQALIIAPLVIRNKILGVIRVVDTKTQREFQTSDINLLNLFAQQAAIAIENAHLLDSARQQAELDPLTSLYNRRYFMAALEREFGRARRYRRPFSILILDLDHFKVVNDKLGHLTGDLVLVNATKQIVANLRNVDIVGRYGGEEFIALLPETDAIRAYETAERVRKRLELENLGDENNDIHITASIGVGCLESWMVDSNELITTADRAMYKAKELGRNRVYIAQASES